MLIPGLQILLREPRWVAEPSLEDVELAHRLLEAWDEGRGTSKSQLEIQTWDDATSHGRHFDRFIRTTLGIETTKPSRQTNRILELESQIRALGGVPAGRESPEWERQLQHARTSCLAALRAWNDPAAKFRTGSFALLFVTAWNSLAIALVQRAGGEWRRMGGDGEILVCKGVEQIRGTMDLVSEAFPRSEQQGLRENVAFWVDLRNAVAHRHLPDLDLPAIPWAQAGLLNMEDVLAEEFGHEFALGDSLSVPLQLSGFRDPGVLASRKLLQASLPLDVQTVLSRADTASPELLADPTYTLRVAFVPVVPASGRNPDAVSYFVRPGEVPTELEAALDQYVVLAKPTMRPNHAAMYVVAEVQRRTGYKFNANHHAEVARRLKVRPLAGEPDKTLDIQYAEYITSFKRYLYSQVWIDRVVAELNSDNAFRELTSAEPQAIERE